MKPLLAKTRPDGTRVAALAPLVDNGIQRPATVQPQSWQQTAIDYYEKIGLANFAADVVSDTIGRCIPRVERRNPEGNDWEPTEDPALSRVFDQYENQWEGTQDLIRVHTWCYQVPGEGFSVVEEGLEGTEWFIYQPFAVKVNRQRQVVTISDATDKGNKRDVSLEQVQRFWQPSRQWRAIATSPMKSVEADLRRYKALNRYATNTAESRFVLAGIQWFPNGMIEAYDREQAAHMADGAQATPFMTQFADLAKASHKDDHSVASVVPIGLNGPKEEGPPEFVELGRGLDPAIIENAEAAAKATGMGLSLPAAMVVGGGTADSNHWGMWLVKQEFFNSAIAPLANRVYHHDLTEIFLRPMLEANGMSALEAREYRVGYDSDPVIVKEDRSTLALSYAEKGIISAEAARDAGGWNEDDAPTEEDLARIKSLAPRSNQPEADSSNVVEEPPQEPQQAAVTSKIRKGSKKLAEQRRKLIATLRAKAETAFIDALRQAGAKVIQRASKKGAVAKQAAKGAAEHGAWSKNVLAAVGVTEAELLDRRFETLGTEARRLLRRYDETRRRELADLLDLSEDEMPPVDADRREIAVLALIGSLTAMARSRLRGDPLEVSSEIEAVVGPIPLRMVASTVNIVEGRSNATLGATADDMPEITSTGTHDFDEAFTGQGVVEVLTWIRGDPTNPFEDHLNDGDEVWNPQYGENEDEVIDERFANVAGEFPFNDYFFPHDRDACQCDWDRELDVMP